MASFFQQAKLTGFAAYLPSLEVASLEKRREIYETHRRRIYSFAFWMTDNELVAEELTLDVFRRVLSRHADPDDETVDRAFVTELRDLMPVGTVTLECKPATEVAAVRRNAMRIHLERAVVQLPPTERLVYLMHDVEGYDHVRISRTIGITYDECRAALHQARLRMRELMAKVLND
ncbi:MAG TPA: sigma-70 family RNA polymerase sigma factor [Terriglobales bacterium]|nr:sigma-70 family RNA polymerase sigma factor [Terriglobales bacterium]